MDTADGGHLLNKGRPEVPLESMYAQKPEACNILGSQEMLIPVEGGNCPRELEGFLDSKTVIRSDKHVDASDHPFSIPRCMDDAGVMVEELTVKNYDGSNLAIVGTSNNRGRMLTRQNQWQQLYQLGNGSGSGCTHNETPYKDTGQAMSSGLEDVGYSTFPEFLAQKAITDNCGEDLEEFVNTENKVVSGNAHGALRTKIISKSGFSEFFVKKTLKGKGIMQRGPLHSGFNVEPRNKKTPKADSGIIVASTALQPNFKNVTASPCVKSEPKVCSSAIGVSLQEWLKVGHKKVNKLERLNIFKQILELLDHAHSQGVVWHDIRPSSFRLLASNQVKYNGAAIQEEMRESSMDGDFQYLGKSLIKKRLLEQGPFPSLHETLRKKKFIQNTDYLEKLPQTNLTSGIGLEIGNSSSKLGTHGNRSKYTGLCSVYSGHPNLSSEHLEENYYASPEELNGQGRTTSSNIYSLGVLFFELLGDFDFDGARAAALSDLRHRILPPNFLSENPREAGFCLWLLHPEPASRPSTRKILEYEVMILTPPASTEDFSSALDQDGTESELLLQFLVSLQEQKQKLAAKLLEDNQSLEADIEEIERRHNSNKSLVHSHTDSFNEMEKCIVRKANSSFDMVSQLSVFPNTTDMRFEKNIAQLETAYFSTRSKVQLPENDSVVRTDNGLLRTRENCNQAWPRQSEEKTRPVDYLGDFFDGFCKYSRYSKFEVRGTLRNSDFNSSSNVICSLSFDRDGDYFAAAGVSKKIKIFGFNAVFNNLVDIHYPAVEMMNKSKLSCVCWNSYIKNYLASTDYDGAVKLWDASTGQETSQFKEHERRAWSVDFSQVCPTKLASGSDDCTVKLWNINEKNSLGTIKNIANVCCVQFSAHSTHLLAFGSADYRTYCYDLRNTKAPWCILGGHGKAVSYVKFLDSETLVSASTDSTLKLWDLNRTNPCGLSTNACNSTFSGHTNEKNFVGLSVSDGYIACGSETNEVCAYYRSLPMPITSLKFGSIDPVCGKETDDDNGQFVSSVCWRGKSDMLIAANSSGCIKVLQMV